MCGGRAGVRFAVGGALLTLSRRVVGAVPGHIAVFFGMQSASGAAARRRTDPLCALRRPQGRSDRFGVYRGNMFCCGNAHAPLGSCTSGGMHSCRTAQSITARRFSIARRSRRDTCTCDTERIRAQSLCVRPWKNRRLITCCSFSGQTLDRRTDATLSSTRPPAHSHRARAQA